MAADSFSEVTSTSWFSRIGGSIKGIIFGIVLIVASIVLLSWNEGRAVERYKTLKEGGGSVVSVESAAVDSSKQGQLIHTTGFATSEDQPSDSEFGISTDELKLIRTVEMYQWKENTKKETQKKLGGGTETVTTYTYVKEWSKQHVDSSNFKKPDGHANPSELRYKSTTFTAKPVTLGAYTLANSQVSKIGGAEPFTLTSDYKAPEEIGKSILSGSTIYIGNDPNTPTVGDIRVSFQEVPEQEVSLVAVQINDSFEPYQAKAGGSINLLESGTVSAAAMFQAAQDSNKTLTWILRGVGVLIMFFGFNLIMAPLSVIADVVPFIGNIVGAGTMLVAMLLTAVAGLITIAIAWIVFRPLLAVALLIGAGLAIYLIYSKSRTQSV